MRWLFLIPYSIRQTPEASPVPANPVPARGPLVLRSVKGLEGYALGATDGEAGRVVDLRIDRSRWSVCALEVDAGRPVLISSRLLGRPDTERRVIPASLTRAAVEASPHVDTDRTAASARELTRHFVQGLDDEIGRVTDFLVDDEQWAIRYLVVGVDTEESVRTAMVPVGWVSWVSGAARSVMVALRTRVVKGAPDFDDSLGAEARLVAHYGRPPFGIEKK